MTKIILYTTPECPTCKKVKTLLTEAKVQFETRDINDTDVCSELVMNNVAVPSAPMIQVGNDLFVWDRHMEDTLT